MVYFFQQIIVWISGQDDGVGLPAGSDAILSAPYVDSFSCEGQAYGYFADVQNNCEASECIQSSPQSS